MTLSCRLIKSVIRVIANSLTTIPVVQGFMYQGRHWSDHEEVTQIGGEYISAKYFVVFPKQSEMDSSFM